MAAAAVEPAVTDANLALGRYDPGALRRRHDAPGRRPRRMMRWPRASAASLALTAEMAALGVVEMVDENMANAARVHAIESGKTYEGRTLIAFGGGGPVHACRVAEKIGISRVLVPSGAGVGSAIGFLRAPVGYEVVRSLYQRFSTFDVAAVNALLADMAAEAMAVVRAGQLRRADHAEPHRLHALCRPGPRNSRCRCRRARCGDEDVAAIRAAYDAEYTRFYDRPVPGSDVEIMSYAVLVATVPQDDPARGRGGDAERPPRTPTARARSRCATRPPARSRRLVGL